MSHAWVHVPMQTISETADNLLYAKMDMHGTEMGA